MISNMYDQYCHCFKMYHVNIHISFIYIYIYWQVVFYQLNIVYDHTWISQCWCRKIQYTLCIPYIKDFNTGKGRKAGFHNHWHYQESKVKDNLYPEFQLAATKPMVLGGTPQEPLEAPSIHLSLQPHTDDLQDTPGSHFQLSTCSGD